MFNKKLKEENVKLLKQNEERRKMLEEIYRMMDYTFTKHSNMQIGNTKALKQLSILATNIGRYLNES